MLSVLLIEDEDLLRDRIRAGLEDAGYRVRDAGSVRRMARIDSIPSPPSITRSVTTMSGRSASNMRKPWLPDPELPIVAMSGNPQYLHNSAQLGATYTLLKPFAIGQLLALLAGSRAAVPVPG